jgi:hypothetical protein
LKYFNNGKAKIEAAIREQKDNAELRYIRLMVQLNAPSLLGYYKEISSDIDFFISTVNDHGIEKKWFLRFTENLLQGEALETENKARLLNLKKGLLSS